MACPTDFSARLPILVGCPTNFSERLTNCVSYGTNLSLGEWTSTEPGEELGPQFTAQIPSEMLPSGHR